MSRRWTLKEDVFLHAFYDAVGDQIGVHDLGRGPGAATRRVAYLKKTGAWAALDARRDAEQDYRFRTNQLNIEDREGLNRIDRALEEATGPGGELYGHRG